MNSLWLVITALAAFLVAYRFYGAFLAARVAVLNDERVTPAHRLRDNVDYQPTRRLVLFGVHFAAIAGPGPLVGPVLASQWGYFPGFSWIIIGACLGGGVHDFVILLASVRRDGRSLPKIARDLLGPLSGVTATLATLFIIIITLAGVAKVVVMALSESPWGMFTIVVTIPAALITGLWMNVIRKGRVGEATLIGVSIVLLGVLLGKPFADSSWGHLLLFEPPTLAIILPIYAAIASILPVWILLCPRDYLSSYMKIGVIAVLAVGILVAHPQLKMPPTTPFLLGGGPVVSGPVWPFVCIVIMCGALSGFHALVSSGTTPKMIARERDILPIGYGAMLLEGFVSVTALVAACSLAPGDYFKINVDLAKISQEDQGGEAPADAGRADASQAGEDQADEDLTSEEKAAQAKADRAYNRLAARVEHETGWNIATKELKSLRRSTGEKKLAGRTGGAVTLAVGMAKIFSSLPGLKSMMSYLYHFVIMFEALFILTLLETGTRVARFILEEVLGPLQPKSRRARAPIRHKTSWFLNIATSLVVCFCWGYLLYTGSIDRLWRMMGIANQLLATIGLAVGTSYLLLYAPKRRYALCTAVPFLFVVASVFAAGGWSVVMWLQEIVADNQKLALGNLAADAVAKLRLDVFSLSLTCIVTVVMLVLSAVVVVVAVWRWCRLLSAPVTQPAEVAEEVA